MKIKLFSRSYLTWEEYTDSVRDLEFLKFMHSTALTSYKNTLKREARGDLL